MYIDDNDNPTERRKRFRMALPWVFFLLLFSGAQYLMSSVETSWAKVLVAILPVLPLTWVMIEQVRFISRLDELQRRLHFDAGGYAGMLTCFLFLAWGIVEVSVLKAQLSFPPSSGVLVLPIFCAIYLLRYWHVTRRIS